MSTRASVNDSIIFHISHANRALLTPSDPTISPVSRNGTNSHSDMRVERMLNIQWGRLTFVFYGIIYENVILNREEDGIELL